MSSSRSSTTSPKARLPALAIAVAAFALFLWLGWYVTKAGEPPAFVAFEHASVGRGAQAAWILTQACYPYVLAPLGIALLVIGWRFPAWRARVAFSLVMLLLCWRGADLFQHLYARPRRLDWVIHRETSFSFPSSHAAISLGFYGLWAAFIRISTIPGRVILSDGLVLLVIAIYWSRLALGAHYVTDLIAGGLLAVALVSAGVAAVPIKVLGSPTQGP
ncbi:MAG: phosphatase PAP2 family protein [Vulcanimicrobiaceae bacterium]